VFHEGDFSPAEQQALARGRDVRFETLHFSVPEFLDPDAVAGAIAERPAPWWRDLGCRHMRRFYSTQVYAKLESFDWYMRLDEERLRTIGVFDYGKWGYLFPQGRVMLDWAALRTSARKLAVR